MLEGRKNFTPHCKSCGEENADITEEAIEIKEYIESLRSFPKASVQDLFLSKNIYTVIVGVGLMIFQQLGGINGVGFYASYIFTSAGFSGKLGTVLIAIIQVPITLLGAILMDRSGRRVLLMVSASGTFLGCFLTGISFYLKAQGLFPEWVPALALSGILKNTTSPHSTNGKRLPIAKKMIDEIWTNRSISAASGGGRKAGKRLHGMCDKKGSRA